MLTLKLPESKPLIKAGAKEVLLVTNADLRESANVECWPVQNRYEEKLATALSSRLGYTAKRAHLYKGDKGHGFISSQREGSDLFATIDPDAPVIVLLTAWQYSHHLAPSLAKHRGPILLLANFDGTWPGLVGMLCMAGTLTSLGKDYARLWSTDFDDEFFFKGLESWLKTGKIAHDTSYLHAVDAKHPASATPAWAIGRQVGEYSLQHKEILGLFDSFCMGMINGVFPQKALVDIGMPMESLSQSALLVEMAKVPAALREQCLAWYEARGMKFMFGSDPAKELTRDQVLEQCAMMIAMARFTQRFGLSAVGVQYQQGLAHSCAASDFAEGAIGSTERFPIPDEAGNIIRAGTSRSPASTKSTWAPRFRRPCFGACSTRSACRRKRRCTTSAGAASSRERSTGTSRSPDRYLSSISRAASPERPVIVSRRCISRAAARRSPARARPAA